MKNARKSWKVLGLIGGAALGLAQIKDAEACGCFTPPDPSVPVVQAGERIVFAIDRRPGDRAHPDPVRGRRRATSAGSCRCRRCPRSSSAPTSCSTSSSRRPSPSTGSTASTKATARSIRRAGAAAAAGPGAARRRRPSGADGDAVDPKSPLVIQDSIGPYDYAVLKADSKDDMLKWLADNHYFVPAGTDATVGAVHPPGRATSSRSSCKSGSVDRRSAAGGGQATPRTCR